jgi:hypothetical protein
MLDEATLYDPLPTLEQYKRDAEALPKIDRLKDYHMELAERLLADRRANPLPEDLPKTK